MELSERIYKIVEHSRLSIPQFANSVGFKTPQAVRELLKGRTKTLSDSAKYKILSSYPEISENWLLTGEGEMLLNPQDTAVYVGPASHVVGEKMTGVKFFDLSPSATFREFCCSSREDSELIDIIPEMGECISEAHCVFKINGDSMEPQIHDGAKVLCLEIKPTKWHNIEGVIVIAYLDRFVIKRVLKNRLDAENYLLLGSDNPDFPDEERVQLHDIRCIFQAMRILSQPIS